MAGPTNPYSKPRRRGHTLLEMTVVMVIVGAALALALPAIGTARRSAAKTGCQTHARYITDAALNYSRNHRERMVSDLRYPAYRLGANGARVAVRESWVDAPLENPELVPLSWLGQLDAYVRDRDRLDCPLVNDHRKSAYIEEDDRYAWDTDYSINRFGLNSPIDAADEPSRAVLFGEPNMPRTGLCILPEMIAWWTWWRAGEGQRSDLEQQVGGSLSFSFVDGHAVRVKVPGVELPFLAAYPELQLSAGSPPTGTPFAQFNNYITWRQDQVANPFTKPTPSFPAPNDRVR